MNGYNDFARYYDLLNADLDYVALAEYFDRLNLSVSKERGILLDLACGTGSLGIELSKLGYDVIGTDCSEEMLEAAFEKPHEGIQFLRQSMTELDMFGTVDCTICSLDGINHLESIDEVRETFRRVSLFSNVGASFIFDVNTLYKHEKILADNAFVYDLDSLYAVWQNDYEGNGRVAISMDFFEKCGNSYKRSGDFFTETAYPLETIEQMLVDAGFRVAGIYDYMTEKSVSDTTEKAVFVAVKL